jgi:hypothetical protein
MISRLLAAVLVVVTACSRREPTPAAAAPLSRGAV